MPFNEALFWFGLTAFGTGLYYIFEKTVKLPYSIGVTVIGLVACAYAEYRHYHLESPEVRLWVPLLVLTWAFLAYTIRKAKNRLVPEKPKEPSKLVIHWANYQAADNAGGEVYQVHDFLRQIISGDSLVFDIENHNFKIGDKDFVPHDPLTGKEKRLQVNYSYGGNPPVTTERREHGRLLLPEDSKIKWLMGERDRLTKTNANLAQEIHDCKGKYQAENIEKTNLQKEFARADGEATALRYRMSELESHKRRIDIDSSVPVTPDSSWVRFIKAEPEVALPPEPGKKPANYPQKVRCEFLNCTDTSYRLKVISWDGRNRGLDAGRVRRCLDRKSTRLNSSHLGTS